MKNKILISLAILSLVFTLQIVSAFTITNVDTPSKIQPGQTATITLTIKNTLTSDYEDVRVNLILDNLPFSTTSSNQAVIKSINEDKTKQVDFTIKADSNAKTGIYKIPVQISYNNSKASGVVSLEVSTKPLLTIDSESYVIKGRNNEINIKIINNGLADIKFLSIKASESGLSMIGSNYVYIGDIDSNDFDTAGFKIFVDNKAGSIIDFPVTINYKDALNQEYQETKQVQIKAYSTNEAVALGLMSKNNFGMIFGILIGIVVLYLVYRVIRRRLKNRKKEQAS